MRCCSSFFDARACLRRLCLSRSTAGPPRWRPRRLFSSPGGSSGGLGSCRSAGLSTSLSVLVSSAARSPRTSAGGASSSKADDEEGGNTAAAEEATEGCGGKGEGAKSVVGERAAPFCPGTPRISRRSSSCPRGHPVGGGAVVAGLVVACCGAPAKRSGRAFGRKTIIGGACVGGRDAAPAWTDGRQQTGTPYGGAGILAGRGPSGHLDECNALPSKQICWESVPPGSMGGAAAHPPKQGQ